MGVPSRKDTRRTGLKESSVFSCRKSFVIFQREVTIFFTADRFMQDFLDAVLLPVGQTGIDPNRGGTSGTSVELAR